MEGKEDEQRNEQTAGEGEDDLLVSLERNKALQSDMRNMFSQFVQAMDQQQNVMAMDDIQEKLKKNKRLEAKIRDLGEKMAILQEEKEKNEHRHTSEIRRLEQNLENVGKDLEIQLAEAGKIANKLREVSEEKDSFRLQLTEAREARGRAERNYEAATRKAKRAQAETQELNDAMSALHAEMNAVQRELDETLKLKDQLQKDKIAAGEKTMAAQREAVKLKTDMKDLEAELESLKLSEQRAVNELGELNKQSNVVADSLQQENTSLQREIGELREMKKRAEATSSELNNALAAVQEENAGLRQNIIDAVRDKQEIEQKLAANLEDLNLAKGAERTAAETLQNAGAEVQRLQSQLQAAKAQAEGHEKDKAQSVSMIRRLEAEKRDLVFDLERRQQEQKQQKQHEDTLRGQMEGLRKQLAEAEINVQQAKARENQAWEDKEGMKSDLDAALHTVELLREEIAGLQKEKESNDLASRESQKETASRLVEFSQKNSKMSAELSAVRAELEKAEDQRVRQQAELETLYGQVGQSRGDAARHQKRVQELEEVQEELEMKIESLKGQLEDAKEGEHRAKEDAIQRLKQRDLQAQEELTRARASLNDELRQKIADIENQNLQARQNLEKSAAEVRGAMEKKMMEERSLRERETAQLKSRVAALANAMASLQEELQEAEARNLTLDEQLRGIQTTHSTDERHGHSKAQLMETVDKLTKDLANVRTNTEMELSGLRRQLKAANQNKQGLDRMLMEAENRAETEKSARESAEARVEELEQQSLQNQLQQGEASDMMKKMERSRMEMEQRFQGALQARDAEVQRLKRRNQMLTETVSRLTVGGGAEAGMDLNLGDTLGSTSFSSGLSNQIFSSNTSPNNLKPGRNNSSSSNPLWPVGDGGGASLAESSSMPAMRFMQSHQDDLDGENRPPTPILAAAGNPTAVDFDALKAELGGATDNQDGKPKVLRGAAAMFASTKQDQAPQVETGFPIASNYQLQGSPIEPQVGGEGPGPGGGPLDLASVGQRAGRGGEARSVTDKVAQALAQRAAKALARPPPDFDDDILAETPNFPTNLQSSNVTYPDKLRSEVELGKANMLTQSPKITGGSRRSRRQREIETPGSTRSSRGPRPSRRSNSSSRSDVRRKEAYSGKTSIPLSSQSDRAGELKSNGNKSSRRNKNTRGSAR